jgi:hypothetical protein
MNLSGRNYLSVIMASYGIGWFSNIVGLLPDYDIAYWTKIVIAVAWIIIFMLAVNIRELFHSIDFFEILATFFLPFIIAVRLPWEASTIMFAVVILVGSILKRHIRAPDEF